jgi:hypothetical protein
MSFDYDLFVIGAGSALKQRSDSARKTLPVRSADEGSA